jgi:repressor of nif and glnA expression
LTLDILGRKDIILPYSKEKGETEMLAKKTSKNQITIPKKIVEKVPEVTYFDVEWKAGVIVLKPVRVYPSDLEQIRAKVKKLGISESTVEEAIKWARAK